MNHNPYTMEVQHRQHPPLSPLSPMRRDRLPALRTSPLTSGSIGSPYSHGSPLSSTGHGMTPLSSTSLSTPFAQSAHAGSPAGLRSPVMGRAPASSGAVPYNPQQWGRPDGVAASMHMQTTVRYAPRPVGPDEPMASPPPPYSAEPPENASDTSSSTATDRSREGPMSSTASIPNSTTIQGLPPGTSERMPNSVPQMISPAVESAAFPPPPPPPPGQARSSSRIHAERLLNAVTGRSHGANTFLPPIAVEAQYPASAQGPSTFAPTARRAASAGALGNAYPSRAAYSNSPVHEGVLPPPPPGPPPSMPRSQSARPSGASIAAAGPVPAPLTSRKRQPVARGSELGPVPPTPANWRESEPSSPNESIASEHAITIQRPLHVETANLTQDRLTHSSASDELSGQASASASMSGRPRGDSGSLMRSPAVRNRSAQGIRDRRSESHRSRNPDDVTSAEAVEALSRPLKDIVVSNEPPNRRASARVTPRSGQFRGLEDALKSNDTTGSPRVIHSARSTSSRQGELTFSPASPQSPYPDGRARPGSAQSLRKNAAQKSLHTPLGPDERPVSHLLHMPNDDPVPVSPLRPESSLSLVDINETDGPENASAMFAKQAMQRYRLFARQEANASTDSERLQLFAQFMVAESQLRREKYATVFQEEGIKVPELLDGVFEADPDAEPAVATATPVQLARKAPVTTSVAGSRRSSNSSIGDSGTTPSRPVSASSNSDAPHLTLDTTVNDPRSKTFVPALSPIASMSAVTGRDDVDSRGRAPSRWWETGSNPSQPGDGFDVFKRSKRETKYMSAVLENEVISSHEESFPDSSHSQAMYGANEYPPEKFGWHTGGFANALKPPSSGSDQADARKLDISRLITLPPPYPRHHPAVNNNHPDLADVRNTVRALNEKSEIAESQEKFHTQISEKHKRTKSWCEHQRSMHTQNMQFRIERNDISQREYDAAEAALDGKLQQSRKDFVHSTFDLFQNVVATPALALLAERLRRADEAFLALAGRLQSDADTHSPNLPQEAGDEKPELMEKLTMLKWLFEAREGLYREKHSVLTQRNSHYKAVICTPYEIDGNNTKLAEAQAFFASDGRQRQAAADAAILQRWSTFTDAIEGHVTRGVEVQLSALWDIAPPLQSLLQRVPSENLDGFEIVIPRNELEENPNYWLHPLRYLYSVLVHAEASSRQFVDGQIGLWCLLQEAREGLAGAKWRARRSRRRHESGRKSPDVDQPDSHEQAAEERRMVEELKERVAAVEEQWVEGLGGAVTGVKEGVRLFLGETGGWDEELESGE